MHRCIKCGSEHTNSESLLEGCPDCGSKYFEFHQDGEVKEIEEARGDRVETIMVREHGVYEVDLSSLMGEDSLIVSDEEGKYLIDINFLLKKMREK